MSGASKKVKTLWKRQNGRCYFCNIDTNLKKKSQRRLKHNTATVEHLIPSAKGGSNRIVNLKMSCHKCNTNRGVMNAVKWFRIASNPELLKKYYDDKLIKQLERNRKKSRDKKNRILERFGIHYSFTTISRLDFEELFGES